MVIRMTMLNVSVVSINALPVISVVIDGHG